MLSTLTLTEQEVRAAQSASLPPLASRLWVESPCTPGTIANPDSTHSTVVNENCATPIGKDDNKLIGTRKDRVIVFAVLPILDRPFHHLTTMF